MQIKALGKGRPALITLFTAVSQAMYKMQTWFRRSFCMVVISLSLSLFYLLIHQVWYRASFSWSGNFVSIWFNMPCLEKNFHQLFCCFCKKNKKTKQKQVKTKTTKKNDGFDLHGLFLSILSFFPAERKRCMSSSLKEKKWTWFINIYVTIHCVNYEIQSIADHFCSRLWTELAVPRIYNIAMFMHHEVNCDIPAANSSPLIQ